VLLLVLAVSVGIVLTIGTGPILASCDCWCSPGICDGATTTMTPYEMALEEANWAETSAQLAEKNTGLVANLASMVKTYNAWMDGLKKWLDSQNTAASAELLGERLKAHTLEKTTDGVNAVREQTERAGESIAAAQEHPRPTGADQYLCNVLKLRLAIPVMQQFADMVGEFLAQGIGAVGRGPTDRGNNTQHSADMLALKCGKVPGYPEPTGNVKDQLPPECRAVVSVPGSSAADMESNAQVLDFSRVYTIPPLKRESVTENGVTYKVSRFDPNMEDQGQKRFVTATQFCYTMAGAHPAPPYGVGKLTAESIVKEGKSVSCRAIQSAFVSQCTYRIGKLTKPDCSRDEMKGFCGPAIEGCAAAKEAHVQLGASYANCQNGLNLYQMERMSVLMCGASRRVQHEGHQGTKEGDVAPLLTVCDIMKALWEDQLNLEQKNLLDAVKGVINNRECFDGTGR